MEKLTELQEARLPILAAREKNRAKGRDMNTKLDDTHNKKLRRLNRAIQAGMTTEKELKASEKILS